MEYYVLGLIGLGIFYMIFMVSIGWFMKKYMGGER